MIREIRIKNFKSIDKLRFSLGRINVFIGENGCGKSNILEAIGMAAAAANYRLTPDALTSIGIRHTEAPFMRAAFQDENLKEPIQLGIYGDDENSFSCLLQHDNQPYGKWEIPIINKVPLEIMANSFDDEISKISQIEKRPLVLSALAKTKKDHFIETFTRSSSFSW